MSELTPLGLGVAALALGRKVLGPTIDQFAKDLRDVYTEWRAANFEKILEKVKRRAGDMPKGEGVHPRVARTILDEGSWIDDDVQQEYLAGLLVASRSEGGDDDSGAYYARIAATLTASQTRLHYAIYTALTNTVTAFSDRALDNAIGRGRESALAVSTTFSDAAAVLSTPGNGVPDALLGLYREGLVGSHHAVGGGVDDEFVVCPTSLGAHLYMRARGLVHPVADAFRYASIELEPFDPEPRRFATAAVGPYRLRD